MKLSFVLLFATTLALAVPALASATQVLGQPFTVTGQITKYYGGTKSAEAAMWSNALQACTEIQAGLILNRLSEVTYKTDNGSLVTASASFVCVMAGNGD